MINVLSLSSDVLVISNDNQERKFNNAKNFCFNNIGTAGAYNFVINNFNFDYLWVWDQDTIISVKQSIQFLSNIALLENNMNYCSLSFFDKLNIVDNELIDYDYIQYGKASGTLYKRKAINFAGCFMNDLFLDYVDYEYFLRLRSLNYFPIQIHNIECKSHILGDLYETIFSKRKYVSSAKRWHLQKINTLKLLKLSYIPLILKLKLILRILFLFFYSLYFVDRKERLVYLLK